MSSASSDHPMPLDYAKPAQESALVRLWQKFGRTFLTLFDQGLVSIANFGTNFLLLRHLATDQAHYAYYTLAFNLMIWVAEFHATLVFTPHIMLTPRRSGEALRRFHGSTLLHHFALSSIASLGMLIAAFFVRSTDSEMSQVLVVLAAGLIVIGLRNYARPYSFTERRPMVAVLLDLSVMVLQIGGIMLLAHFNMLDASTAIGVVAIASAVPAIVWLLAWRDRFSVRITNALTDLREEWPQTRWIFLAGIVWNAGMQLYPWLIAAMRGKIEVAVWGACYQLAAIANPIAMGLQNLIGPRIAEAYVERDRVSFVRFVYRIAFWSALLMVPPGIVLSLIANAALRWLTHGEIHGHQMAIALLSAGVVLQSAVFALSRGLFALHRADLETWCCIGPLVLLFTAGAALTYHFGVEGVALSLLLSGIVSVVSRAIVFSYAARRDKHDHAANVGEAV